MAIAKDLASAIDKAWDHQRRWVLLVPPESGIEAVLCSPRTRKDGINYWIWGYRLNGGKIVWRASKRPSK